MPIQTYNYFNLGGGAIFNGIPSIFSAIGTYIGNVKIPSYSLTAAPVFEVTGGSNIAFIIPVPTGTQNWSSGGVLTITVVGGTYNSGTGVFSPGGSNTAKLFVDTYPAFGTTTPTFSSIGSSIYQSFTISVPTNPVPNLEVLIDTSNSSGYWAVVSMSFTYLATQMNPPSFSVPNGYRFVAGAPATVIITATTDVDPNIGDILVAGNFSVGLGSANVVLSPNGTYTINAYQYSSSGIYAQSNTVSETIYVGAVPVPVQVWNGTSWVTYSNNFAYYGGAWQPIQGIKYWNGSAWVTP